MKIFQRLARRTLILSAVLAQPGLALANSYIIPSGTEETSARTLTMAGDSLTIAKDASLYSSTQTAVTMSARSQVFLNYGSVKADTDGSHGVYVGAEFGRVENHGLIELYGLAYGVNASAANTTVVNFGRMILYADCAYGIYGDGANQTVFNSGTIFNDSTQAGYGLYLQNSNGGLVINTGTVRSRGSSSNSITVEGKNTAIVNFGSLLSTGDDTEGIYSWHTAGVLSGNIITNFGRIEVSGTGSTGIYANDRGALVLNAGTVIHNTASGVAIRLGQPDQTLTIMGGSAIAGEIQFDHVDSQRLDIARGVSAKLRITNMPDNIDTNGQAYAIDGSTLVVLSHDALTAGHQAVSTTTGAVASSLSTHMGARRNAGDAGTNLMGYMPVAAANFPNFSPDSPEESFGFWTSAYGALSIPTGGLSKAITQQAGGLVGFDARISADVWAGAFAGVGRGVVDVAGASRVDTTTVLAGIYGSYEGEGYFLDMNLAVGGTVNKSSRTIVNNTIFAGSETATADFSGLYVSPTLTLGMDSYWGDTRVTPSLSLGYSGIFQQGYVETGSTTNLSIGDKVSHVLNARGQVDINLFSASSVSDAFSSLVKLGAEGSVTFAGNVDASIGGAKFDISNASIKDARGFAGIDLNFKRGTASNIKLSSEVGYGFDGVLSAKLQGGFRAHF